MHPFRALPRRKGLFSAGATLAALLAGALSLSAAGVPAASRLAGVTVETLANGMTVLVLEDPTLPLVSTQMLYKAGARDELPGATGVAHFTEHMAFRAAEHFPGTEVVSRIYSVGGEWHGYTWIDQTTYFETVPKEHLGLALAIQADRMARLRIPPEEVEAERGAVLTELQGYANDPGSVLNDAVVAASFAEHPYRNNTIGWVSDVKAITHADIVGFYRRHYVPANAVLAVAGDVRTAEVLADVRRLFGALPAGEPSPLPRTVEPPQRGERRIELRGTGDERRFQVTYRAPAASDPDFPAFLLLQAFLSGSSGANFQQDGEPFPARPGSRLVDFPGAATFFAPTAQPYVFSITGAVPPEADPAQVEADLEKRIAELRDRPVPAEELERARRGLLEELVLDVETPEAAAHQMAFYTGIGAFDVLQRLPDLLAAVTPGGLQQAAVRWLQPWQRTLGWNPAGPPAVPVAVDASPAVPPKAARPSPSQERLSMPRPPQSERLANGIGLIVQRIPRVPAGFLRVIVPTDTLTFGSQVDANADEPLWRHTSLGAPFRTGELPQAVDEIRQALASTAPRVKRNLAAIDNPEARLNAELRSALGSILTLGSITPAVVVAVGDLDEDAALALLREAFGRLPKVQRRSPLPLRTQKPDVEISLTGGGIAQSQIGYAVPAPGPQDPDALAFRILLYILTHEYEGRLGKELITNRGLLYYIGSGYHSDGKNGWISMTAGVNPENLEPARKLFSTLREDLRNHPPTEAEIAEAKQALLGRRLTGHQSNEEISALYAAEWIEHGKLLDAGDWERQVRKVSREDVLKAVPQLLAGVTAVVSGPAGPQP